MHTKISKNPNFIVNLLNITLPLSEFLSKI